MLARPTTSPEDVSGMIAARAVVTERGGSTSHAAVVTRALGRPSVVGVGEGATAGLVGRELTVDGSAGVVYAGRLPTEEVDPAERARASTELIEWARELSPVAVVDDGAEARRPRRGRARARRRTRRTSTRSPQRWRRPRRARLGARHCRGRPRRRAQPACPPWCRLPGQHAATLLLRLAQARQ